MESDWLAERDRARRVRKQQLALRQMLLLLLCVAVGLIWVWWSSRQPKPPVDSGKDAETQPVASPKPLVLGDTSSPSFEPSTTKPQPESEPSSGVPTKPPESRDRELEVKPIADKGPDVPLEADARAVLDAFVREATLEAKVERVLRKPGLEERMKAHYVTSRRQDPDVGEIVSSAKTLSGGQNFLELSFQSKASASGVGKAYFLKDTDGVVRLDWESFVGHGTMDWTALMQSRTTEEVILRAYVSADDYYNYEFTDSTRFLSFRLKSADGTAAINGFTAPDSPVGRGIQKALEAAGRTLSKSIPAATRVWAPLIVKVQFPPAANSDHCLLLTRLVEERWLVVSGIVE